ncbi:hypothetical protein PspLS_07561 [Pyricularia sp. CBS 133598]|nr:hypothetical protein PspLS_07561 [Pyricularia sp. CBS 133598]
MPNLSAVSNTGWSFWLPLGAAMYLTPERAARNVGQLAEPLLALGLAKGSGDLVEQGLERLPLGAGLGQLAADEQVDGVALVGPLGALLPLDAEDARVEAQPPVVGLVAGEAGAVDAGLLAGAEADDLAVGGVADRVALGVLERDGGDGQVAQGRLGQGRAVLGHDDGAKRRGRDLDVVAMLGQRHAVDGAHLLRARDVVGVHLQHQVAAALLLLEDLERRGVVAGSNDTVRDLLGDDLGSGQVDDVAESDHVAKRRHAVGAAGAGVGLGQARGLNALNALDHRGADGGAGGRHVLEAGGGGEAEGGLELLDQGPGVEGVEQVDVARAAAEDLEGQLTLPGEGGGGLLVGVGAVAEGEVLQAVRGVLLAEEVGDGGVVVGRVLKGLEGVELAARLLDLAAVELLEELGVVGRVAQDGDARVVLCGGADQGDAANVDLLNGLGDGDVDLGDGVLEGVQVADDVVDLIDALLGKILLVRLEVAGQDAGVHGRVEGLDPASQHLGGLGDGRDVSGCRYRAEAGFPDHLGGTSRRKDANIVLDEAFSQIQESCLVVDGDDGNPLRRRHLDL